MPELFPSFAAFLVSAVVIAAAQMIYATVGFGAGMFAIALLAFVLPDLAGTVAALMILTSVTEIWVLLRTWRHANVRLLVALLPTMALGMWFGTRILVAGDVSLLKRLLGLVVMSAGAWFLASQRRPASPPPAPENQTSPAPCASPPHVRTRPSRARIILGLPIGLLSGTLAGLFGTGGPPVIIFLHAYRLDKAAFRATLLWFFLMSTLARVPAYLHQDLLTWQTVWAAVCLLPASLAGTFAGMQFHHRLDERYFAATVSLLLIVIGFLLALAGG